MFLFGGRWWGVLILFSLVICLRYGVVFWFCGLLLVLLRIIIEFINFCFVLVWRRCLSRFMLSVRENFIVS